MLKFKERPEHFIVNEFSKFEFKEKGKYGIFTLHKHGLNTYEAIQTVATKLRVKPNTIGGTILVRMPAHENKIF